jgi:hypothetical protein
MELAIPLAIHRAIASETGNQATRESRFPAVVSVAMQKRVSWQKELSVCNQVR